MHNTVQRSLAGDIANIMVLAWLTRFSGKSNLRFKQTSAAFCKRKRRNGDGESGNASLLTGPHIRRVDAPQQDKHAVLFSRVGRHEARDAGEDDWAALVRPIWRTVWETGTASLREGVF
ncbi:hypothetical protein JHK87_004369 [Glycine soja]|nr:hypothetical protein JHK87_004369 [Glycine soja]